MSRRRRLGRRPQIERPAERLRQVDDAVNDQPGFVALRDGAAADRVAELHDVSVSLGYWIVTPEAFALSTSATTRAVWFALKPPPFVIVPLMVKVWVAPTAPVMVETE